MATNDESPYTLPAVTLIFGVLIGGFGLLASDMEDPLPDVVVAAMFGIAGLLTFIGATAIAVLLGTSHLTRRD